jgi:hypothetical protein
MLNIEQAIEIVVEYANKRWGSVHNEEYVFDNEREVIEKETLWFIGFTEKNTEEKASWIGAEKGCIIHKRTGEFFQPGSAYSLDTWIWGFELGVRENTDITINKINDMEKSMELLYQIRINYLKNGKSFNSYSKVELKERLSKLPCIFKNQRIAIKLWVLEELVKCKAFEFELNTTDSNYGAYMGEFID